jgi:hypothetical protein
MSDDQNNGKSSLAKSTTKFATASVFSDAAALQDHLMRTLKLGTLSHQDRSSRPDRRTLIKKTRPRRHASSLSSAGAQATRHPIVGQKQETTYTTPRVESSQHTETARGNQISATSSWTCASCTFLNQTTRNNSETPLCKACGTRQHYRAKWNPVTGIARDQLTLAQKRGLVKAPAPRPDDAHWKDAFARSLQRCDSRFPCPICQQVGRAECASCLTLLRSHFYTFQDIMKGAITELMSSGESLKRSSVRAVYRGNFICIV